MENLDDADHRSILIFFRHDNLLGGRSDALGYGGNFWRLDFRRFGRGVRDTGKRENCSQQNDRGGKL